MDIGRTHPLIDTNLNDQSLGNRAYAADKYAASKDRRYRRIINDNNLPYGYKSLCMDTLGAFGTSLWSVIDRATDPNTHPKASGDYDPWRRPDPRREYVLPIAFANQVGDATIVPKQLDRTHKAGLACAASTPPSRTRGLMSLYKNCIVHFIQALSRLHASAAEPVAPEQVASVLVLRTKFVSFPAMATPQPILVNGEWIQSTSTKTFNAVNPATKEEHHVSLPRSGSLRSIRPVAHLGGMRRCNSPCRRGRSAMRWSRRPTRPRSRCAAGRATASRATSRPSPSAWRLAPKS